MSGFEAEFQRRLRAVVTQYTGEPVPDTATVTVEVESEMDGTDTMGYSVSTEILLLVDGRQMWTSGGYAWRPMDKVLADLLAVPDA